MPEAWQSASTPRNKSSNLRAAEVAGAQWGVIGCRQLAACGVSRATAFRWRDRGQLHPLYPGVYALGHASVPIEGRMVAALIRAGEGAVLSHATAAWWWKLIDDEPRLIELSAARRIRAPEGVVIHRRRRLDAARHRRFPITTLPQTFLDLAATQPLSIVRLALAQADYRNRLDPEAVAAQARRGSPGSARLRQALERHQPRLAHTRSWLERAFLAVLEATDLRLPDFNARLSGWPVDAVWRSERVVVELDGHDNHRTRGQIERDRRKELALRRAGFVVLRYTYDQLTEEPELVIADLVATLSERSA